MNNMKLNELSTDGAYHSISSNGKEFARAAIHQPQDDGNHWYIPDVFIYSFKPASRGYTIDEIEPGFNIPCGSRFCRYRETET